MAFQSYFDALPFNGSFDNGMPVFPFGGAYGGVQQPTPQPTQAPAQGQQAYQGQATTPAVVGGTGTISGFGGSGIDGTSPTLGGPTRDYGDAQFAAMGFNTPSAAMGYNPQNSGISPAQLTSFGSIGLGNYGQGVMDRINSVGNAPDFNKDNWVQAAINAAGMFSPFVSIGAGIAQGFNELEPGFSTGNAIGDVAGTPGFLQQGTADIVNWINRQFGGNYMTSSSAPSDPSGPSSPQYTGVPYSPAFDARYPSDAAQQPGNLSDPRNYGYNSDLPIPGTGEFYGGGDFIGTFGVPNPYSMSGNMATDFMQGATFGGGRWDTTLQPDNNGGWGQ